MTGLIYRVNLNLMFERSYQFISADPVRMEPSELGWLVQRDATQAPGGTGAFRICKRLFDVVGCLCLLPVTALVALALLALNAKHNPGPVFFRQQRMGHHCRAIWTIKFRTMQPNDQITRGPNDPLETHRITGLGQFLRRTRLDELPQIINVLRGEMSLIGPRPDYFPHAHTYLLTVPEYRARHTIRPGISGLAQVDVGYVSGSLGTRSKAIRDLHYIENAGFWLELYVIWRTLQIILSAAGR